MRIVGPCMVHMEDTADTAMHFGAFTEDGRTMAEILAAAERAASEAFQTQADASAERPPVWDAFDALPIDASQEQTTIIVEVSGAGAAALAEDPSYEEWVLGLLQYDFAFTDPWSSTSSESYIIHRFGATKDEYGAETGSAKTMETSRLGRARNETTKTNGRVWKRPAPVQVRRRTPDPYVQLRARLRLERLMRKLSLEHLRYQTELLEHAAIRRHDTEEMRRNGRRMRSEEEPRPRLHGIPAGMMPGRFGAGL